MEEGARRSQFSELKNSLEHVVSSTRSNPDDMGRSLRSTTQSPKKRKPNTEKEENLETLSNSATTSADIVVPLELTNKGCV